MADDEEKEEVYGKQSGDKEEDSEDNSDLDEEEEVSESEIQDDEEQSKKLMLTLFIYARLRSLATHINQKRYLASRFVSK